MNQETKDAYSNGELEIYKQKTKVRNSFYRWVMLICGCLLLMGNYLCYDIPGVA